MTDWMPSSIRGKTVAPAPEPPPAPQTDPLTEFSKENTPALVRASYILQKHGSGIHFLEEAAAVASAACQQMPDQPSAWDALGTALRSLTRTDEALVAYQSGIDLEPSNLRLRANIGSALIDAGYIYDGIVVLKAVLDEKPDFAYAFLCYTRAVLLIGDFERGWMLYAQRRRLTCFDAQINKYPLPIWDGKRQERVLFVGEEGSGEKIMFSSMIPEMQARGAEVVLEINKSFRRFAPLMRRSFPGVEVTVVDGPEPPPPQSQILAGDLPRILARQERHRGGDIGGLVVAAQGDQRAQLRLARIAGRIHVGIGVAHADDIDVDPARPEFARKAPRKAGQRRLGHRIGGKALGKHALAQCAADHHDAAIVGQMRDRGAAFEHNRADVHVQHLLDLRVGQRVQQADIGDAGIVDQDIEAAEACRRLLDRPRGRLRVGGVALDDQAAAAQCAHLVGDRFRCGERVVAGQRDVGAIGGEAPHDAGADALAATGDQCPLAAKIAHAISSLSALSGDVTAGPWLVKNN